MRPIRAYFLHGLESTLPSSKVEIMEKINWKVGAHHMNYKGYNPYEQTIEYVTKFNPDIVIGSSLGGLIARYISTYYNIPSILLNPALHSKNYNIDLPNEFGKFEPKIWALLGENDMVVNSHQNRREMKKINASIFIDNHAHRTPADIFNKFILKILPEIQSTIFSN